MSRIILSKYEDGNDHVVVGWDHPARGAFWQEWASAEEIKQALDWLEAHATEDGSDEYRHNEAIADTEVKRDAGMWPGIPLDRLIGTMPEELRHLMTDRVMALLHQHAEDRDSGYNKPAIDLSDESA